jgi:hypothetical protein
MADNNAVAPAASKSIFGYLNDWGSKLSSLSISVSLQLILAT